MRQVILTYAALIGSLSSALAGQVLIVDDDGPADYANIQSAVTAAFQDATILVRPGSYGGFSVDNKSISIVGTGATRPVMDGQVTVLALGPGRTATLSSLRMQAGLTIVLNTGFVHVNDCVCRMPGVSTAWHNPGMPHLILGSQNVVINNSVFVGRHGTSLYGGYPGLWDGTEGESGLNVQGSRVALYNSTLSGGDGGDGSDGSSIWCIPAYVGDGGDGITASPDSHLYVDSCTLTPGVGGSESDWCDGSFDSPHDGHPIAPGPVVIYGFDPALLMSGPASVASDSTLDLVVTGNPGTPTWLVVAETPDWLDLGPLLGVLHMSSVGIQLLPLGSIPGSGTLQVSIAPPGLTGTDGRRVFIQVFGLDPLVSRVLGNATMLTVHDPQF